MRTRLNADFQSVQFSMVAARMRTVARNQQMTKEERLKEIAALGDMLIGMAKINVEHWNKVAELPEE